MTVIEWLDANAAGFADRSREEREAAMHFALLWSYFEAEFMDTDASAGAIAAWLQELNSQDRLRVAEFDPALAYFRNRYVVDGQFTHHFDSLRLRGNSDRRQLVEDVLLRASQDAVAGVTAVFIIIYRFRNNFFHGNKWGYFLQGQRQNFEISSDALIRVMEM